MLGEVSDEPILSKSLNEIWEIILGIPFDLKGKYGEMANVKLGNIKNIDDNTFLKFKTDFENKIDHFTIDEFMQYSFQSGSQTYFWIPLSSFPGND